MQAGEATKLARNLALAKAFHALVVNTVHPKTAMPLRDQLTTDSRVVWTADTVLDPNDGGESSGGVSPSPTPSLTMTPLKASAGDGTGPALSARFVRAGDGFFRNTFPVLHADCFANQDFSDEVLRQVLRLSGVRLPSMP